MLHGDFRRKLVTMLVLACAVSACGPLATGPLQTGGYADRAELRNYAESIRGYPVTGDEPIDALIVVSNQQRSSDGAPFSWVSVGVVDDKGFVQPVPSRIRNTNLTAIPRGGKGTVNFVGLINIITPMNSLLVWWGADTVELPWSQILESDIGNIEPIVIQSPDTSRPLSLPMSGRKVDSLELFYIDILNDRDISPIRYASLHPDTDPFIFSNDNFPDVLPLRTHIVLTRSYYHVIIAPNGKRIGVLQDVDHMFTIEW